MSDQTVRELNLSIEEISNSSRKLRSDLELELEKAKKNLDETKNELDRQKQQKVINMQKCLMSKKLKFLNLIFWKNFLNFYFLSTIFFSKI